MMVGCRSRDRPLPYGIAVRVVKIVLATRGPRVLSNSTGDPFNASISYYVQAIVGSIAIATGDLVEITQETGGA
jgi:hypothetical protein